MSVGVWIDAGSRFFEDERTNGVSTLFWSTSLSRALLVAARRTSSWRWKIWGAFNAYTSREQTAYFAKVVRNDLPRAIDLLADVLQHSRLEEKAIEREREVRLREQEEVEKQTEEVIFDHLHAVAYPDSSLGMTILGPRKEYSFHHQETICRHTFDPTIWHHGWFSAPQEQLTTTNLWNWLTRHFQRSPLGPP